MEAWLILLFFAFRGKRVLYLRMSRHKRLNPVNAQALCPEAYFTDIVEYLRLLPLLV